MNTILRLFYDLSVYRQIIASSFTKSLARFLLAYLILSFGYAVYVNFQYAPEFIQTANTAVNALAAKIPTNAEFNFTNYQLKTTNLSAPFIVDNYLYIDTSTDSAALASSAATITLTNTHLRITDPTNTHELSTYQDLGIPDFSATGQEINSQLTSLTETLSRIRSYLPLFLTVPIFFALLLVRFLHALFYSLLFLLVVSFSKGGYRYGEILKITLNTIIVAESLNLAILAVYHASYATIFSVAFIGITILAYLNLPARISLKPKL